MQIVTAAAKHVAQKEFEFPNLVEFKRAIVGSQQEFVV